MQTLRKVIMGMLICFIACIFAVGAEASVVLRTIATNPSSDKTQVVPVKSYLPQGVEPQHIINKGNFEVGYDFEKSLYYVSQEVKLSPKQWLVLEVEIKDVWVIEKKELDLLHDRLEKIMKFLKKTQYYESAVVLAGNIRSRLTKVTEAQKKSFFKVEEHIASYETNMGLLKKVKEDLELLEKLVVELGGKVARQ